MHPFMALWIWTSIAPSLMTRMFDPTFADDLKQAGYLK